MRKTQTRDRIIFVKIPCRTVQNIKKIYKKTVFLLKFDGYCRPLDNSHKRWKNVNTGGKLEPVTHALLLQNLSPHSSFLTIIHVWRRRYIFSFVGHFHQTTMLFSRNGTTWRNNSWPAKVRAFFKGKFCRRKEHAKKADDSFGVSDTRACAAGFAELSSRASACSSHSLASPHSLSPTPSFYSVKVKVKRIGPFVSFYSLYHFLYEIHKVYPQVFYFLSEKKKTFLVITAVISIQFSCIRNWQRTRNWRKQRNGLPTVLFFYRPFNTTMNGIKTLLF